MESQQLQVKYSTYFDLVNQTVEEVLSDIRSKFDYEITYTGSTAYLVFFEQNMQKISTNFIKGKPDSFIEASCLAEALLKDKPLWFTLTDEIPAEVLLSNYRVALTVALKIASEPTTYILDEGENQWIPKSHPKVELVTPVGLIEKEDYYDRIIKIMATCAYNKMDFQILPFAHLLYTIYLFSSDYR